MLLILYEFYAFSTQVKSTYNKTDNPNIMIILKKIFYAGIIGISVFEILNVFFIMPMPGSQEIKSLDIAYFLYSNRWIFRLCFVIMIAIGAINAFKIKRKWLPAAGLVIAITIIYFFNFQMTAEKIFRQPGKLIFKGQADNRLSLNSIVIGVENNGKTKAYPIQFLVYHHQVQDTIGGKPFMVTYCSVCRTGRVYEPLVKGHPEKFRLVGMDHFNAMFEDITTRSWWRQGTGEAVTGPLKGESLPEIASEQLTIKKLFELHPDALIMQADAGSLTRYDSLRKFEQGLSEGRLTRTDSLSWKNKSWVIGVKIGTMNKVYDWNQLKKNRLITDSIGKIPVVIVLSTDGQSFTAFAHQHMNDSIRIMTDSLQINGEIYDFSGRCLTTGLSSLERVAAYQEFWHSWKTFNSETHRIQL